MVGGEADATNVYRIGKESICDGQSQRLQAQAVWVEELLPSKYKQVALHQCEM